MGVELVAREAGDGPVLILLHGLFGSSRNWVSVQKQLAANYHVVSVDLRNHGASAWSEQMDYDVMAEDVVRFIEDRGYDPVSVLGHSMGGKVAMTLALRRPELLNNLIVADIAPVVYQPHYADYIDAMLALDLTRLERRGDADRALAPTIASAGVRAFLLQNLVQTNGEWSWRINLPVLASCLTALGEFPVAGEGKQWAGRVMFIRGGNSQYILPAHAEQIKRFFPNASQQTIANAGHWLHAEQPAQFITLVNQFLQADS